MVSSAPESPPALRLPVELAAEQVAALAAQPVVALLAQQVVALAAQQILLSRWLPPGRRPWRRLRADSPRLGFDRQDRRRSPLLDRFVQSLQVLLCQLEDWGIVRFIKKAVPGLISCFFATTSPSGVVPILMMVSLVTRSAPVTQAR